LVRGGRELAGPAAAGADPPLRGYRGGPLGAADGDARAALAACRDLPGLDLDVDRALRVWDQLVHLPQPAGAPAWFHGDLLAENLLVGAGRLAGVLDLGGLGVGDPSVDLVVAWEVLGPAERETFRDLVGVDKDTWLLGAGWALLVAALTFPYYWHTMPARCRDRMTMARAVLQALG
ncbi:MAG: phosphotransferase, partial [Nocardioides sp.]|nr:phosphotransferase [Nocardioides sp.]